MALDNWSPGGTHFDGSTQPPSLFDDTFNDFVNDLLESFAVRHSLTGEMKFNVGIEADKPASPTVGDGYLNLTTGTLEIYRTAIAQYIVGTVDLDAGASGDDVTVVANAGSPDFTQVHAAGVVPTYIVFWESGTDTAADAVAIHKIDSSSQFTLAASYAGTTGVAISYVIRFTAAATWFAVNRDVLNNYTTEHYLNGTHNIPNRTDGTNPDNVENGNAWTDTQTSNKYKFRVGGVTKEIASGLGISPVFIEPLSDQSLNVNGIAYSNTKGSYDDCIILGSVRVPASATSLNFSLWMKINIDTGRDVDITPRLQNSFFDDAGASSADGTEVTILNTSTTYAKTDFVISDITALRGTDCSLVIFAKREDVGGSLPTLKTDTGNEEVVDGGAWALSDLSSLRGIAYVS